jgi:hypothetical protein
MKRVLLLLGLATVGAGCSSTTDNGGHTTRPPTGLNYIELMPTAPLLCADSIGFWAFKGITAEGALQFPEPGEPVDCSGGTEDFVRLKIDAQSLLADPNGVPFQTGDSVFISLKWVGGDTIMVQLDPTGLEFDPGHPAELKVEYGEAGDDLNEDGAVTAADTTIEHEIGIWRQAQPGDDFVKLGSTKLEDIDEIEVKLNGFSRYAIAY